MLLYLLLQLRIGLLQLLKLGLLLLDLRLLLLDLFCYFLQTFFDGRTFPAAFSLLIDRFLVGYGLLAVVVGVGAFCPVTAEGSAANKQRAITGSRMRYEFLIRIASKDLRLQIVQMGNLDSDRKRSHKSHP